ncbi:N-acetyltransferase [Falsigemmobacter faecalis]|uniref:N-acetyltransferase n=1 Tax=Falsigemmobacter faecalis TaxID=2488730 RepID=A0A3P3DJA9_9RHOB|nr:N-acetyltransferase [Falsigemmobacter faecalis]
MPPPPVALGNALCVLKPLTCAHLPALWQAFRGHDALWDYMFTGPFPDEAAFRTWAESRCGLADPLFYAIRAPEGDWSGLASFMRIDVANGVIEVGSLTFSPALQGTSAATGAMFAMMEQAFRLGYRRYEWKCHSDNLPSRRAAERLGFSYEGIFRHHMVVKGRNRDTVWYAITDEDWPALKEAYELWCRPETFDDEGRQKHRLSDLTAPLLKSRDPGLR